MMKLVPEMSPERISELLIPTVWSMRVEIGESLILAAFNGYCCDIEGNGVREVPRYGNVSFRIGNRRD